jgi:hypothetical protein
MLRRRLRLMVPAVLAALVVGGTAVASADVLPPSGTAPFAANSFNRTVGDVCPMGWTEGNFIWGPTLLVVSGTVADHPTSPHDLKCGEDRYFTAVIITPITSGGPGPAVKIPVDNGERPFQFTWPRPLRVVVQVCRQTPEPDTEYCGRPHEIPIS